ncbi:Hypothetical protein HDN1F_22300 [gamma proteobacterium HdN1]|nr:Hypothetical protein HDN1F_22300 [gamma proteobacterium HdN1]
MAASDREDAEAKRFGINNWVEAYREPLPQTFRHRQRVAERLASIGRRIIRADVSDATLIALEARLAEVDEMLGELNYHPHAGQYAEMMANQADQTSVLMAFDYDAVTGASNPAASRLSFDLDAEEVLARVTLDELQEGGPGNAHGGILSALLDVVLARVQHREGWIGVTGYLNTRYLHPTPLHQPLVLKAWPASRVGRVAKVEGGIWCGDRQTVAAEALYIAPRGLQKPIG